MHFNIDSVPKNARKMVRLRGALVLLSFRLPFWRLTRSNRPLPLISKDRVANICSTTIVQLEKSVWIPDVSATLENSSAALCRKDWFSWNQAMFQWVKFSMIIYRGAGQVKKIFLLLHNYNAWLSIFVYIFLLRRSILKPWIARK